MIIKAEQLGTKKLINYRCCNCQAELVYMVGTQMIQQVYIPCTIKKMTFEVETRSLNILV